MVHCNCLFLAAGTLLAETSKLENERKPGLTGRQSAAEDSLTRIIGFLEEMSAYRPAIVSPLKSLKELICSRRQMEAPIAPAAGQFFAYL